MTDRLEWFPFYPSKLLGALAGMKAPEGYVYTVVLLRIYESGGECRDSLDALATRTRMNRRIVSDALDNLFRSGRLKRGEGGGITNPVAAEVIADSRALRERRKHAGAEGANRRWQKAERNQRKPDSKPNAKAMANDAQLQLQDTLEPNGSKGAEAPKVGMVDPPLDAEADLYRRGRQVLGKQAGGVITKLIRAKGGNVYLARAVIEQASTRGDAMEYVAGAIRGGLRNGKAESTIGGFSGLGAHLRQKIASEGADEFDPAADRR